MTKFWTSTGDLLIIFAAITGSLGAVITAFGLPVDFLNLILFWGICAFWSAFGVNFLRSKGILILLLLITALAIWRFSEIIEGAKSVLYTITSAYNEWTYIPIIFEDSGIAGFNSTIFFAAAGLVLTIPLSAAVCLRRSLPIMLIFTIPILLSTFMLFNTRADMRFLLLSLGACLALLINGSFIAAGQDFRGRAAFPAILLSIVLLTTAGFFAPHHEEFNETVLEWSRTARDSMADFGVSIERFHGDARAGVPTEWLFDTEQSPIADSGSRILSYTGLLEIYVSEPGIHYLRGFSMEYFDGRTWHRRPYERPIAFATPRWSQAFLSTMIFGSRMESPRLEELTVDTPDGEVTLLVPTGAPPTGATPFRTGEMTVRQTGDITENVVYKPYFALYSLETYPYTTTFFMLDHPISAINPADRATTANILRAYTVWMQTQEIYTQINPDTALSLRQIAALGGVDILSPDRETIANQIMAFVSSAAEYTLTPAPIPTNEDFAIYFLQSSREGFCVHFATTAALMLRALDIPSRFVTGFAATVRPHEVNSTVILTDRHAHAWVEVYFYDFGWKPFDATPPGIGFGFTQDLPEGVGDGTGGGHYQGIANGGDLNIPDNQWGEDFMPYYEWEYAWQDFDHMPQGGGTLGTAAEEDASPNNFLRALFIAAAFITILIARRRIVVHLRQRRFAQENASEAAISIWKYIKRFNKDNEIPTRIEDIALEARFSKYTITEDARAKIIAFSFDSREREFDHSKLLGRVWKKYVLCL